MTASRSSWNGNGSGRSCGRRPQRAGRCRPGRAASQRAPAAARRPGDVPPAPLLFSSFADAHNGYGDIDAVAALDAEQVGAFVTAYYRPANAHLPVVGDVDAEEAVNLVRQMLGAARSERATQPEPAVPEGPPPADATHPQVGRRVDVHATDARTAWGFHVPDPVTQEESYLAMMLLCEVLDGHPGDAPERSPPGGRSSVGA